MEEIYVIRVANALEKIAEVLAELKDTNEQIVAKLENINIRLFDIEQKIDDLNK